MKTKRVALLATAACAPLVTVKVGETFYEGPDDVHLVGRNASSSKRARFVVVLLKKEGAPVLTPVAGK